MKQLTLAILFVACATLTARGAEIDFHRDVAPIPVSNTPLTLPTILLV